ncbi:hypothetical protein [Anaerolentibacter hominis]
MKREEGIRNNEEGIMKNGRASENSFGTVKMPGGQWKQACGLVKK